VLVAILAVVAAVLLLLPTTTIARPAVIAPVNASGTVSMLAVAVDRVPWVTQLRCVADDTCYIPNVGGDADGFPTDMPESIVAARIAAQALTSDQVAEQPLPPNTQGPSAGLAFGLAGYLEATGSRLGGRVAATGTLDPYGHVGPVSGVAAKAALAEEDGIDLLLVPERNAPLTRAFTGRVVEVATLTEALDAACALPDSECVPVITP
jgi:Lon protease (S16) C-terminal proteolytic domain